MDSGSSRTERIFLNYMLCQPEQANLSFQCHRRVARLTHDIQEKSA